MPGEKFGRANGSRLDGGATHQSSAVARIPAVRALSQRWPEASFSQYSKEEEEEQEWRVPQFSNWQEYNLSTTCF